MHKSFLKNCFVFFLILILISGCEGQSCVEADDFGEYDTDIITVDSVGAQCEWSDDGEYGTGSETIRQCLDRERSGNLPIDGTSCSIKVASCNDLKECLLDTTSSCASNFTIVGSKDDGCQPEDNETRNNFINSAYNSCLQSCVDECTSSENYSYEPSWVLNNLKEDGSYLGIELSKSNKVYIQALGSVVLQGSVEENNNFSVNTPYVQDLDLILSKGIPFTLTGKWCRNGKVSNCTSANQIGEFGGEIPSGMLDNSNIEKRIDFLRRGVVILDPLPTDSSFSVDGVYSGPLRSPDFGAWKCSFDSITGSYDCFSEFNSGDSGYDEQNQSLYGMENTFVKRLGGSVIPENVKNLIITNPFANFECKTDLGGDRYCIPSETEAFVVDSKNIRTGFTLTKNGKTDLELVYPSKLAFRIIQDKTATGTPSGECKITVSVKGNGGVQNKIVNVKADDSWHFLTESENSGDRIVLGENEYSTLKPSDNSDVQNLDETYKVDITFDSSQKWTDENGNEIPCGDGMVAFFIPQNEILVETSGFVSFKNLLGDRVKTCNANSSTDDKECVNDFNLTFDIINPMYDIVDKVYQGGQQNISEDLLKKNFYEYRELASSIDVTNSDGSTSKLSVTKPVKQSVTLKLGANNDWSEGIYVRKGQILRFDETNWYSIARKSSSTEDANSFVIKDKVLQVEAYAKRPSEALVMRIVERPAIICKGTAPEKFSNSFCNLTIDENGEMVCSLSYRDYCNEHYPEEGKKLTQEQKDANARYCLSGCYGDFFVDSNNTTTTCYITGTEEDKKNYPNITLETCTKCKEYLDSIEPPSAEYDVDVTQCYDLENYLGAVSNITNENDPITGEKYSNKKEDEEEGEAKYGNLTAMDVELGAIKLKSIFENGTYGSLEGLELDATNKGADGKYESFVYNSTDSLQFTSPRSFRFLVIDNPDFTFDPSPEIPSGNVVSGSYQATSYKGNDGNYSFSFTPQDVVSNGAQMSVFVAHKDWIEDPKDQNNYVPTEDGKFKAWVVQYNMERVEDGSYGQLNPTSPYEFNANGILVNKDTKAESLDMSTLPIQGVNEDEYKDLRLFFKIIDKQEKTNTTCSAFQVQDKTSKCKCKDWPSSRDPEDCSTINCGDDFNNIENVDVSECKDLYSNNSGSYTVQLKTPRDILNSTGYIIKYIMDPIMELLDGKTTGIAVDHNGDPIPCKITDATYKYGGDLAKWRVGTACSTTDPLVGKYCKKATFSAKSGTCGDSDPDCEKGRNDGDRVNKNVFYEGAQALLPGARQYYWGKDCSPDNLLDPTIPAEEYPNFCFAIKTDRCVVYRPQSQMTPYDDDFGDYCKAGDKDCYQNCSTLDTNTYATHCKFVNDGNGFVQRFYQAVINDTAYQIILKLCFTLMIMFYGLYYLLGMAELTHGELIKRVIKISFIYLMVGTDGWYYYNMFFVKFFKSGVDYLVFSIAGAFDDSSSLAAAFVERNFYDKSVLFSGVDKNLSLMFSDQVTFKIWGLMFVSFFGWLYVFLIYSSIIAYILTVANALLLYVTAQFFISMLLAFGPIFFVLLVFEKTKEMFNKWINNLVSFSLEQIFLLTCLSLFNMLVYNIIKFVLSYRVCWRPIWVLNIPVLGNIELMSFWKATTASSPSAAASSVPGLFQVLLIYLIANLMKKFIEFATNLGSSMGGGGLVSSDLSGALKKTAGDFYNRNIKAPIKSTAKKFGTTIAKKTIGYKTEQEEKQENESNKVLRKGLKKANREADKAVENFKKDNAKELLNLSTEERNKKLADFRRQAFKDSVESNSKLSSEMRKRGVNLEEFADSRASKYNSSNTLLGAASNQIFNSFFSANKSETKNKKIEEGKRGSGFSDYSENDIRKITKKDYEDKRDNLKKELKKGNITREEYDEQKAKLKEEKHKERRDLNIKEHERKDVANDTDKARRNVRASMSLNHKKGKIDFSNAVMAYMMERKIRKDLQKKQGMSKKEATKAAQQEVIKRLAEERKNDFDITNNSENGNRYSEAFYNSDGEKVLSSSFNTADNLLNDYLKDKEFKEKYDNAVEDYIANFSEEYSINLNDIDKRRFENHIRNHMRSRLVDQIRHGKTRDDLIKMLTKGQNPGNDNPDTDEK